MTLNGIEKVQFFDGKPRMNSPSTLNQPMILQDQYARQKRKLRISVTDRCNFKCVYCMPEHPEWMNKRNLLSFEQLEVFCDFMVQHGIQDIRITGGEPLMRQGVVHFIARLQALRAKGLQRISMTTNAHYLQQYADDLKQAGLDDLNISLDSLVTEQFQQLTQKSLSPVLDGIMAAKDAGFQIKINTVLIQGVNDDQILPLVAWSKQHQFEQRFIEFMPLDGDQQWSSQAVVTEQQILNRLQPHYQIEQIQNQGSNPARQYLIDGQPIGIISTISHSFCGACDRLRLNAQGELFNCLFATEGLNLKADLEQLASFHPLDAGLESAFLAKLKHYIWHKKSGFEEIQQLKEMTARHESSIGSASQLHGQTLRKISMHMIGG